MVGCTRERVDWMLLVLPSCQMPAVSFSMVSVTCTSPASSVASGSGVASGVASAVDSGVGSTGTSAGVRREMIVTAVTLSALAPGNNCTVSTVGCAVGCTVGTASLFSKTTAPTITTSKTTMKMSVPEFSLIVFQPPVVVRVRIKGMFRFATWSADFFPPFSFTCFCRGNLPGDTYQNQVSCFSFLVLSGTIDRAPTVETQFS